MGANRICTCSERWRECYPATHTEHRTQHITSFASGALNFGCVAYSANTRSVHMQEKSEYKTVLSPHTHNLARPLRHAQRDRQRIQWLDGWIYSYMRDVAVAFQLWLVHIVSSRAVKCCPFKCLVYVCEHSINIYAPLGLFCGATRRRSVSDDGTRASHSNTLRICAYAQRERVEKNAAKRGRV